MEPVRVGIALRRTGTPTVFLLDYDSVRTTTIPAVVAREFEIDGAQDKTCYYLAE